MLAAILQRPIIEKILANLALDPQPPPRELRAESAGRCRHQRKPKD
jgi:hypothetical protein